MLAIAEAKIECTCALTGIIGMGAALYGLIIWMPVGFLGELCRSDSPIFYLAGWHSIAIVAMGAGLWGMGLVMGRAKDPRVWMSGLLAGIGMCLWPMTIAPYIPVLPPMEASFAIVAAMVPGMMAGHLAAWILALMMANRRPIIRSLIDYHRTHSNWQV